MIYIEIKDGLLRLADNFEDLCELDFAEALQLRAFLNGHIQQLRPAKDWNNCPYERHSDDCDCQGAGGDR